MDSGDDLLAKLSKRLKALIEIRKFEIEKGRGILFTELVERLEMKRITVSKCHDSLSDIGLVFDEMIQMDDGSWSKVMSIDRRSKEFVDFIVEDVRDSDGDGHE